MGFLLQMMGPSYASHYSWLLWWCVNPHIHRDLKLSPMNDFVTRMRTVCTCTFGCTLYGSSLKHITSLHERGAACKTVSV